MSKHKFIGVDISESVKEAEKRFGSLGIPANFIQADLTSLPEEIQDLDIIFSEGVLHHTDSVEASLRSLAKRLSPGGLIMFYVYSKKAPIREFTDDFIREKLASLSNEEAREALMPLTKLGQAIGSLQQTIVVEDDVPMLGIKKGEHSLQRLLYCTVFKAFYNPNYSLEQMNHINFDWFRPQNCHRHTPDELRQFVSTAGLEIERLHEGPSGLTVIARRQ